MHVSTFQMRSYRRKWRWRPFLSWFNANTPRKLILVSFGLALLTFGAAEIMRDVLAPDLGRHWERLISQGTGAIIVGCLSAKLLQTTYKLHRATTARMEMIAEANHHIRNALQSITMSAYLTSNQQAMRVIAEGVERIDWVLKEVLPAEECRR